MGRTPLVLSECDVMLVIGDAKARLHCRGHVQMLPPHLFSIVEVGEVVVLELPNAAPCQTLYLTPGLLADACGSIPALRESITPDRRVVLAVVSPEACRFAGRLDSEEGVERLIDLAAASGKRFRAWDQERVNHAVVWRVRDLLRDDYSRKVTLRELGSTFGMRRPALVRAFTREVGMPPHAYQTLLRVVRARELIASGQSLSDVSVAVGFTDQSHLTRHFKRLVGITPGRYARARRARVWTGPRDRTSPLPLTRAVAAARRPVVPAPALELGFSELGARAHSVDAPLQHTAHAAENKVQTSSKRRGDVPSWNPA
jgi:AraC-like DNA-binding protein